MAKTPIQDEEKRSYAGTFALCAGALLAVTLWSVLDELFLRRPWKEYQAQFTNDEIANTKAQISAGEVALDADPAYRQLATELAAARTTLTSGEAAARVGQLARERERARIRLGELDQEFRFVKSEIEEARYEYDHALHEGLPTAAAQHHIEELEAHRDKAAAAFKAGEAEMARLDGEIVAAGSQVARLEDEISTRRTSVDALYQKLDSLAVVNLNLDLPAVGRVSLQVPPVPSIHQVVLEEYDRSKFDTPIARVDRCESCHVSINKRGFENGVNPLKTHPDRDGILGAHPPEQFGCTPCHAGQGAAINSVEMAHGEVKHWAHPLRRGARVQASCAGCHVDVQSLPGTEQISRGERLFEQLGCHGCHLTAGYDGLPKVGPSLRRVGAKLGGAWMVRWIENPHAIRPRTRMPNFMFERDQATSIAAYLLDASNKESREWLQAHPMPVALVADADTITQGKALVESLGCRGCHAFTPDGVAGVVGEDKDVAPNLSDIASKVGPRWAYHWIRNPRAFSPSTRMPSLRLSDGEGRAITAYLMTLGAPTPAVPDLQGELAKQERIAAGQKLVRKNGCFGCHDIPGMENESRIGVELSAFGGKVLEEFFFGDRTEITPSWDAWTYHKLKNPRIYATKWIEQVMPNFQLADPDIEALRTFLSARVAERVPERFRFTDDGRAERLVAGRRLVTYYNCTGCHVIEGKGGDIRKHYEGHEALAPPNLLGEGSKVQSAWLFRFLKAPVAIRPWLEARMPTFGFADDEAAGLISYFDGLDRVEVPYAFVDLHAIPPAVVEAGTTLMSRDYFDCFSCHQQGEQKPEGPPEGWAPDLALAHERLSPGWVIRWITDPQTLMPGTKMPSFYPDGPPDILDGKDDRQIEAIRDYIWTLGSS